MTITTNHPISSYGMPVILDDDGEPMDYADGIKAVRERLGLTQAQLADACGVTVHAVRNWEQRQRLVGADSLNVMIGLLGGKVGVE